MRRYSLEAKKSVLMYGQVGEYTKASKQAYKGDTSLIEEFKECYGDTITKLCKSVCNSKYRKRINIQRRFKDIVESGNAIFCTFTFNDETMNKTSEETRRRYVSRYLKQYTYMYVANVDYGDKKKNPDSNEREHYHALVMMLDDSSKLDGSKWLYGFTKFKRVGKSPKDTEKVAKYVSKLSQHAIKECTRDNRLIWSRGWKQYLKNGLVDIPDGLLPF